MRISLLLITSVPIFLPFSHPFFMKIGVIFALFFPQDTEQGADVFCAIMPAFS